MKTPKMKTPKLHADTEIAPKRRIGFRVFAFAVFAALFGLAPAAQAEDRGRERAKEEAERGREEAERGEERGEERREELDRERSQGHDTDSGGKKE